MSNRDWLTWIWHASNLNSFVGESDKVEKGAALSLQKLKKIAREKKEWKNACISDITSVLDRLSENKETYFTANIY